MDLFRTEQLNDHLYRIHDITDVFMYLVIGNETAALIDTGCGFGDLRSVVERLTDKPVVTILTHGHVDHALGAAQFDAVYMNRLDIPVYIEHCDVKLRLDYLRMSPLYEPGVEETMLEPADTEHFLPMGDDTEFDLGGIHIRMYACPGHTPGSMCALIEEDRILITGDACNPLTFLYMPEALSVSDYKESLVEFGKTVKGRFDEVLFSHGNIDGEISIVEDGIELCDRIIAGQTDGNMEFSFMQWKGLLAAEADENLIRKDNVRMNIVYNPEKIA